MANKLSMRGFAEVAAAAAKRKPAVLKRFQMPESDESVGMSNYYVKALSGIRHHHKGETDEVSSLAQELLAAAASEDEPLRRAKYLNNHRALSDYLRNFGTRKLVIKPGKQLYFIHGQLVISAKPDLVAEENGKLLLIKLNLTKKDYPGAVNPMLLHLLFEAASKANMPIVPTQVETLQVASGSRVTGPKSGFPSASVLEQACDEILSLWFAA